MAFYRVLWVGDEGHIAGRVIEIDCSDDEVAILQAKAVSEGHPVEVWFQGRLIAAIADGGEVMAPREA